MHVAPVGSNCDESAHRPPPRLARRHEPAEEQAPGGRRTKGRDGPPRPPVVGARACAPAARGRIRTRRPRKGATNAPTATPRCGPRGQRAAIAWGRLPKLAAPDGTRLCVGAGRPETRGACGTARPRMGGGATDETRCARVAPRGRRVGGGGGRVIGDGRGYGPDGRAPDLLERVGAFVEEELRLSAFS